MERLLGLSILNALSYLISPERLMGKPIAEIIQRLLGVLWLSLLLK
jgi:hypothetical protein